MRATGNFPLVTISGVAIIQRDLRRRSVPEETTRTAIEDIRVFNGWRFDIPQTVCLDSGYIVDVDRCPEAQATCDITANQPVLASFIHAGRSAVENGSLHERKDPTRPKDTLIYPDTDVAQWASWQFGNVSDFMKITAEVNGPSTQQQTEIHVPDDGIIDAATIQKILEQGQFVTPTLNVFEYAYRDPVLQQYFDVQPGSNRTPDDAQTNAQLLYEAGVPLIAGTDSVGSLDMTGTTVSVPFDLTLH
ncbi:putative Amidohydrolase-related domain-containing protein [Seiridium cardinale]|uniref:Amidohydrolase-related domain-containing protein n=1 Tax=Seiridium cardinale TaxID=138064 RepID=A0ABR2Y9V6_9PEZI